MTACFADTFYYLALLNPTDAAHKSAVDLTERLRQPIITTAWVLTELGDGLAATPSRRMFGPLVARLEATAYMTIVRPTQDLFNRGLGFYDARPDKEWSLTDCISMVVMQELRIRDVLTGDHHFE